MLTFFSCVQLFEVTLINVVAQSVKQDKNVSVKILESNIIVFFGGGWLRKYKAYINHNQILHPF